MYQLILLIHVVICLGLIGLVLLQQGKGAEMGAAFGSGASQTVFGSHGSGSFLLKFTGMLAAGFFVTSLVLGTMATYQYKKAQNVAFTTVSKAQKNTNNNVPQGDKKPLSDTKT